MTFMLVVVAFVIVFVCQGVLVFGRIRLGIVLESVGRTQRFAFQAHYAPIEFPDRTSSRRFRAASCRFLL